MDSSDEKESEEVTGHQNTDGTLICADCRTSKTPLWRGGPSGPKSLCNACGIRYRKRRTEMLGLTDGGVGKEKSKRYSNNNDTGNKMSVLSMFGFRRELLLKQRSLLPLRRRRRLREEEEAAVLLMALSYGLIYFMHDNTNDAKI